MLSEIGSDGKLNVIGAGMVSGLLQKPENDLSIYRRNAGLIKAGNAFM
jgi:hypothetical protein